LIGKKANPLHHITALKPALAHRHATPGWIQTRFTPVCTNHRLSSRKTTLYYSHQRFFFEIIHILL